MTSNRTSSPPSRRTFLRAAGVSVALPMLTSLLPRELRAGPPAGTKRFIALFFPNGSTRRQDWMITGSGTSYTMGTAHASLLPFQSKISMFKNLDGAYGGAPDHARGTASFLTGAPITNKTNPTVDVSIDQAIVNALNPQTAVRSLHLGPNPYPNGPPADTGWPSGYNAFISWSSPTSPNPPLESAQLAFNQVFVPPDTDPAMAAKRIRMKQSVLDHTIDQIGSINPRLGKDDRIKLDAYLSALRDVESTLQVATPTGCGNGTDPGSGLAFPEHTKAMIEVIRLALQCDATRVITYSMDYGFGNKDFSFLGLGTFKHHNLSHSGTAQNVIDSHKAIVRWYMDQVASLLGKLDAIDESGATLLDNSLVYVGSDVGNPWSHDHSDLTAFVAGGCAGALTPGRVIDASSTNYDSVLLGMANAVGANLASFSGATTPFTGL
jgi:hypothetical protein